MKAAKLLTRFIKSQELENKRSGAGLTEEQKQERFCCENSFLLFIEKAWPIIEGNAPFVYGWHVKAICEHLEALYKLDINRLIINIPPRLGKSNICSVLYCAWVWTKEPHLRFLYSSYAQVLSIRDSVKCRRLIQSNWYQKFWGNKFRLMGDVNTKLRFDNDKTGYRIASSVEGSNTGEGGHFEITDDPNNVLTSDSEVTRNSTNNWHDFVMSSRHAGIMSQFRRLVVQQRTHEMDVTGNILAKDDSRWVHLCLPMEYEEGRKSSTIVLRSSNNKIWEDPRTKEGELLWPAGVNQEELDLFKQKDFRNDSYRIAGQLQQRPSPAGGGILREEWFKPWKHRDLPEFEYVLQSWDTALAVSEKSCYSACTSWGVFKDRGGINNIMLLSVFRERVEYPDLRKMASRLANNYMDVIIDDPLTGKLPPNLILIEEKVSGYSLLQDLMRANLPVMKFNPSKHGDKVGRCRVVSHLIENGLVWLPTAGPTFEYYNEDSQIFLHAAMTFPSAESNDIIDSMSQAFIRITSTGWIMNKEDPVFQSEPAWKTIDKPYW